MLAVGFLAVASGCSTSEIPGTAPADIATIVVATQRAAPTPTPSPVPSRTARPSATPTPTPTFTPTAVKGTPVAPTRIELLRGATSAVISGQIVPGEAHAYVVQGIQAQPMLVRLDSSPGNALLSIMSQGGTFFVRPGATTSWRGTLPQAGDYYLGVYPGTEPTDYTLAVQLATRIRFKEGESSATLAGKTPDGTVATYTVFGAKDDRLTVTLSGAGRLAALSIFGFINNKSYLSASDQRTSFRLDLSTTQDYVIEIVPQGGETVGYVLDVQVEKPID